MKNVSFSDYSLTVKETKQLKHGTLIRFVFDEGIGYGVCHPWEELGDEPLAIQKQKLRQGVYTSLTSQAQHFAKLDAEARSKRKSLFHDQQFLKSHYLLTNCKGNLQKIIDNGFTHIKIKLKGTSDDIVFFKEMQKSHLKLRLDFNSCLTYKKFCSILEQIEVKNIDFIEDPFPMDETLWKKIEADYSVHLAADFEKKHLKNWVPHVQVVKPAIESSFPLSQRVIFTSYLAHPLEQVSSAFVALQHNTLEVMGLCSHYVFEENEFSQQFHKDPSRFFQNLGYGFGFSELLHKLDWHD